MSTAEERVKDLTDEELEIVNAERDRRIAERDQAIQDSKLVVRAAAFAMCNGCKRLLSEEVFKKNDTCPFCGHDSAEIIDHEE